MTNQFTTEQNALFNLQTLAQDQISELATISIKQGTMNGYAKALLSQGAPVYADTQPIPRGDINGRKGWYYTNTNGGGEKFNYYYFNGLQENLNLEDVINYFFTGTCDNYTGAGDVPFIVVYTYPTGVGDAGPFFHSRITYDITADQKIGIGERCLFYTDFFNQAPQFSPFARRVLLDNKTVLGDGADTERILYMSVHSNSGATTGQVQVLMEDMGFITKVLPSGVGQVRRQLQLVADSQNTSEPYELQVAKGNIPQTASLYKFGYNPDVNGSLETISLMGGIYVYPAALMNVYASSSNADDTLLGPGVRTIKLEGLDGDYNHVEEIIELAGQTQVQSANQYLRVNRSYVLTAGTLGGAQGTIYIADTGAVAGIPSNDIYAQFSVEHQTQQAVYTVPAGFSLYIDDIIFTTAMSIANKKAELSLVVREFNSVFREKMKHVFQSNEGRFPYQYFEKVPEKSDIELRAITDSSNNALSGTFQGILVKN